MFYQLLKSYMKRFPFPHRGLKYFLRLMRGFNLDKKQYLKKTIDGFFIYTNPNEHIQQQLFWYGYYEPELVEVIKKLVKPGDVFIDGGANIGYFSLLAAKYGATVFAFEPVSEVFEQLKINLHINNEDKITPIQKAFGDIVGEKEIYISGSDNRGMSSFERPENFSGASEIVDIIRLDDWVTEFQINKINIIKLDIEGSELVALKGMETSLKEFKPLVITEVNLGTLSQFGIKPADIVNFMRKLNFEFFKIDEKGNLRFTEVDEIKRTTNIVFIHKDRKEFYKEIFN